MTYDEFLLLWTRAMSGAGLPAFGPARETLEPATLDRRFVQYVHLPGGQLAEPFDCGAEFEWIWSPFLTARGRCSEEDFLNEVFGQRPARAKTPASAPSWIRIDVRLRASLPFGHAIPMPAGRAWSAWTRECVERLETVEPLLPKRTTRKKKGLRREVLAWRGDIEVRATCGSDGELQLEGLKLAAFQLLEIPVQWDDPERGKPRVGPERELEAMFKRTRAALYAWTESLDHIVRVARVR